MDVIKSNVLERAAKMGIANAQFYLGEIYYQGIEVIRNKKKAKSLFLKAAKQGYVNAQYYLGQMYFEENNVEKSKYWHMKAAKQGHVESMYVIKLMDAVETRNKMIH